MNDLYFFTAAVILLRLSCPLFLELFFGKNSPDFSISKRIALFNPYFFAMLLVIWCKPDNIYGDGRYLFFADIALWFSAALWLPMSGGYIPALFRPKKLALLFGSFKTEIDRNQIMVAPNYISYSLLSHADTIPQKDRHTVHTIKLPPTAGRFLTEEHVMPFFTVMDGQVYAVVYMGQLVGLKDISLYDLN